MKYSVLDDFKVFLHSKYRSRATAKQYYFWAVRLLAGQFFSDLAAFLNFAEFANINAVIPALSKPKKRRNRKLKSRKLADINSKINVISDKRLSLSYKIMLATGLRVGELASIKKDDIKPLQSGGFSLAFIPKRGGRGQITIPARQRYICNAMNEIIKPGNCGYKVFYSAGYLQSNAKKRGFACHDLRRAFAKMIYRANGKKLAYTCEKMRHASPRTTKIYLKSKIEV